jgi:hypothetical protein
MRTSSEWIEYRKYGFLWDNEITKLLADFVSVEAERDEWKAKGEKLAEAVEKIARHPHNDYNTVSNGRYEIGVVDGHRCAALIAGAALEEWRKE